MHNLHFQGVDDEAVLIDAPTQDVTLFCLLCLPVTSSWIMSLTYLLFISSLREVLWSAQLCCCDASVFMLFPACVSCLIDFCPMNSCINMPEIWNRLYFRDKSCSRVFVYIHYSFWSWHLYKSMFNKGLGAWNFFFLNAQLKLGFWSLFGLHYFIKLFSFKYEFTSFEPWDFHLVWMTYILSFVCLAVSCHNCSWITFCEFPHAHHEHLSHLWLSLQFSWCLSPEQGAVLLHSCGAVMLHINEPNWQQNWIQPQL